jgi:hypothetical protein
MASSGQGLIKRKKLFKAIQKVLNKAQKFL